MPDNIPTTADATLDRAYEEAMEMLIDARDFAKEQREASSQLESDQRLRLSQYTMQVTARLTQLYAEALSTFPCAAHVGEAMIAHHNVATRLRISAAPALAWCLRMRIAISPNRAAGGRITAAALAATADRVAPDKTGH